jgi:hypothetical protein
MVATILAIQIYTTVKTVGWPKRRRVRRPPLDRAPFDPYVVRDDLAPTSEADFDEIEMERVL